MPTELIRLRNIGPAMAQAMAGVGIDSVETLRDLGTDASYARLLAAGHRPHFIAFYVIEMALQGRPWNDCRGAEKAALRTRFDALKLTGDDPSRSALEIELDRIGVINRRPRPRGSGK